MNGNRIFLDCPKLKEMGKLCLIQNDVILGIYTLLKNSSQCQERKEVSVLSNNNFLFYVSANVALVNTGKGVCKITYLTELVTTEQKELMFECYQSVSKCNATAEERLYPVYFEKAGKCQAERCLMPSSCHHIK